MIEDVQSGAEELLNFVGFNARMHPQITTFVEEHTKASGAESENNTIRNSKETALRWMQTLSFDEVKEVQNVCANAMRLWGYKMMNNPDEQKNFVPYLGRYEYDVNEVISNYVFII